MMTIQHYVRTYIDPSINGASLPFNTTNAQINKGTIITKYGEIEDQVYFLISGIIEIGLLQKDEEKILDFFFPNSFFSSYASFISRTPSDVQITALTMCTVEMIQLKDLLDAYKTSLLANKIGRVETERLYLRRVKREKDLLTKTAEERYLELLESQPYLISQLPVNKIARYLGIHPESLSRIRKQLALSDICQVSGK